MASTLRFPHLLPAAAAAAAAATESTAISLFLPTSKPPSSFLSYSSKPPLLLSLSISTSLLLHSTRHHHHRRNTRLFTPFVASQTSDWAPQQDEEEGQGEGEEELAWGGEEEGDEEEKEAPMGQEAGGYEWANADEDRTVAAQGGEVGFGGGRNFVEPNEEAKLFVGNLPYDMDSDELAQMFDQAGVIEVAEVIYNRDSDQSRGFGFVTMSTVEEAEKAVEMFHRYDVRGRLLTVNKAAARSSRAERGPREFASSFRLYVGNLPWQVDDARLEQVFSEHGKVVDARVVYDRETGRSRGFGFVTMASREELEDAIAGLDGQNLDGRALRVNVAEERARRGF